MERREAIFMTPWAGTHTILSSVSYPAPSVIKALIEPHQSFADPHPLREPPVGTDVDRWFEPNHAKVTTDSLPVPRLHRVPSVPPHRVLVRSSQRPNCAQPHPARRCATYPSSPASRVC